jgi:hypothetical protein
MSYELVHFNGSEKLLKSVKMLKDIKITMDYLDEVLSGSHRQSELLRQALSEMDWRHPTVSLKIIEGRRYQFKGIKNGVAIDGNFSSYEYLHTALLRLQIGYDQGLIDAGVILLNSSRSEKSHLGTSKELALKELEVLSSIISIPVVIALFNLGTPHIQTMEESAHAA